MCQSPFQHPVRFHPIFDLEMTRFLFHLAGVFSDMPCPLRCCCLLSMRSCRPSPCYNLSHTCCGTCLPLARAGLRRQQFCSLCSCTFFNVCILLAKRSPLRRADQFLMLTGNSPGLGSIDHRRQHDWKSFILCSNLCDVEVSSQRCPANAYHAHLVWKSSQHILGLPL